MPLIKRPVSSGTCIVHINQLHYHDITHTISFADKFSDKHSGGIQLYDDNSCALIHANSYNKIAFIYQCWLPTNYIVHKVQLDFKPSVSRPVVGLASTDSVNCDGINFEFNEALSIIWFVGEQRLIIRGKVLSIRMPHCNGGAIVEIMMNKGHNATFTVLNPGEKKESITVPIQSLFDSLIPFVGAVQTGSKYVSFQLIENTDELTSEKILTDVTKDTYVDKVYGNMHVLSDGKRFTRTSTEQGNSCVLLSRKITKGQHRWSIRIICDFGASLCVGLARYPFKLSEDYIRDPLKHIYRHPGLLLYRSYRGLLYMDGRQLERSLQPLGWQHNSSVILTIEVDMDKRTVEVLRNGKSLGIAFSDISGPLQPVICFYASYEKELEFISYETTETSHDLPPQPRITEVYQSTPAVDIPPIVNFDHTMKYGSLTLSSDQTSISRDKSQSGNAYCLMNLVCKAVGVYRFSFVIETDQGASVCIGVTDVLSPTDIRKVEIGNIYLSPSFYLYRSFQGMLYVKGRELTKRFDEFWMSGTLVEMTVDIASNEAIVQYTVNGKDQGIAFAGLKPPLRPVVAIYAGMEKRVTLIHFEYIPKLSSPQRPVTTSAYINDVNTSATHASKVRLPTVATPLDAEKPSSQECMVCGRPADVILLPCQHSMLCAEDSLRTSHCIICNQRISGFWNILSMKR